MAQIVCIDTGTLRSVCGLGDIVTVHDDDVKLTGKGYSNFKVIKVANKTNADIRAIISSKMPELREEADETISWKSTTNRWYKLASRAKYSATTRAFTNKDITDLGKVNTPIHKVNSILDKMLENIHLDPLNFTIEVIS